MIIGLAGYARSGKDEVAKILVEKYGFKRVAFADAIREFVLRVNPILDTGHRLYEIVHEFNWDIAKSKPETRRLLQEVGVVARDMFGQDFWVNLAFKKFNPYQDNVVISDVRFSNEMNAIRDYEGKVYRIIRSSAKPVNSHVSETAIDSAYYDAYVPNEGTLEDLEAYVIQMMERNAYKNF